jgi:hypothetical protein
MRASLPAVVVFPDPLQAGHQDHRRRLHCEVEAFVRLTHQLRELAVHEADERLPRREARDDILAQRLVLDRCDEILDHRQRDVGFEQRDAHFAQRVLDVLFGEPRLAADLLDDLREACGQVIEHG